MLVAERFISSFVGTDCHVRRGGKEAERGWGKNSDGGKQSADDGMASSLLGK